MPKTLEEHYGYLSDRVKLKAYESAINRLVQADHTVLDLGCGSGLLGLMALRAGARKVLFVDEGEVIEVARQTIAQAGFGDKAEFFRTNSYQLALPEKVDIVVCDHIGYFGFDYGVIGLLADAKKRFLKADGIVVPAAIELQLAPIDSEACRKLVGQWRDGSVPGDFEWLGTTAANSKHAVQLEKQALLAEPTVLATLDLGPESPPYLSYTAEFTCAQDGTLDGVAGWFDCRIFDDVHMSNSPTAAERLERPQAFFPVDTPVPVKSGTTIKATVMIRHEDGVIGWIVELPESGERFAHTTFNGLILDNSTLNRGRPDRVADLNDRGRARQIVLSYCDGEQSIEQVEARVIRDHPDLFPSANATSTFVRSVLQWDTGE
jgi:protein arginine N-methyltransferase 1